MSFQKRKETLKAHRPQCVFVFLPRLSLQIIADFRQDQNIIKEQLKKIDEDSRREDSSRSNSLALA